MQVLYIATTTIDYYGSKPHLSITHMNVMHNTQQFFNHIIFMFV